VHAKFTGGDPGRPDRGTFFSPFSEGCCLGPIVGIPCLLKSMISLVPFVVLLAGLTFVFGTPIAGSCLPKQFTAGSSSDVSVIGESTEREGFGKQPLSKSMCGLTDKSTLQSFCVDALELVSDEFEVNPDKKPGIKVATGAVGSMGSTYPLPEKSSWLGTPREFNESLLLPLNNLGDILDIRVPRVVVVGVVVFIFTLLISESERNPGDGGGGFISCT